MNTRILIAVVVSMFVCQQVYAQVEDDSEAEATELEGTWEVVSFVFMGEQIEINEFRRFEGNRFYSRRVDGDNWQQGSTFTLDPLAMPATIDKIAHLDFYNVDFHQLGIYELDGNSLTICLGVPESSRPDRFESSGEHPAWLIVLRRIEEESE